MIPRSQEGRSTLESILDTPADQQPRRISIRTVLGKRALPRRYFSDGFRVSFPMGDYAHRDEGLTVRLGFMPEPRAGLVVLFAYRDDKGRSCIEMGPIDRAVETNPWIVNAYPGDGKNRPRMLFLDEVKVLGTVCAIDGPEDDVSLCSNGIVFDRRENGSVLRSMNRTRRAA